MDKDSGLRKQLIELIEGGGAHTGFVEALEKFPAELAGQRPDGAPHSLWELLEHMRIAQWDILQFSRDPDHKSPKWPDEYWPTSPEPPRVGAWATSVHSFRTDMQAMCALIADPAADLNARIPHGTGQTLLREALLLADHNSYHLGQLVLVGKMIGAWG